MPAVVRYRGAYVHALFASPHPEAAADGSLQCAPPAPRACLTPAQQLRNWRFLAAELNALLGAAFVVPDEL